MPLAVKNPKGEEAIGGVSGGEFEALKARGRGDRDHSAILSLVEEGARHRIGDGG